MIGRCLSCAGAMIAVFAPAAVGNDWPAWRGPEQTGMTRETAVVTSWSPDGDNLLWKVPVGGRTTPIVMDGRVYVIGPLGSGDCLRERVVCLDADTGETRWQHELNVFHTDIVENRLGWTALVGDPETGNVYAHGTGGELLCFNRNGQVLWKRSLAESFGRDSGYGGRLHTPMIDEDRLIIAYEYILTLWATGKKKSAERYVALNKRTGEVIWTSAPGSRPSDTAYSTPVVAVIGGRRMLVAADADGNVYGMLARTGERVWTFQLSKRGLNTTLVVDGSYVYATHSEENYDGTAMGRVVCIDGTLTGDITKTGEVWRYDGLGVGYSSPAIANGRLYVVTNSARMHCLDAKTGKEYWRHKLGRVMKGSPVVTADGVIYVTEVNGRFLILKDLGDRCEQLDVEEFSRPDGLVVELNGSPALADGRVYFMTSYETFALGAGQRQARPASIPDLPAERAADVSRPKSLLLLPGEVALAPGERLQFEALGFDANGRPLGQFPAQWSLHGLGGAGEARGSYTAPTDNEFLAGVVRGKLGDATGEARIRVSPALPIIESFDAMAAGAEPPGWVGVDVKTQVVEKEGGKVLKKLAASPSAKYMRMRAFSGPPIPAGYTVQADLLGETKPSDATVLPDMGLINSRYKLILLGTEQVARLVTYTPIPRLQVDVPFFWKAGTWYRAKLSVEVDVGQGRVRGKVWPRDEAEPSQWTVEMVDPCPNREGSPGLYGYSKGATDDAPGAAALFDNYQVKRND